MQQRLVRKSRRPASNAAARAGQGTTAGPGSFPVEGRGAATAGGSGGGGDGDPPRGGGHRLRAGPEPRVIRAAPRDVARSALWLALYALLALQPILILLAAPSAGRGGFGHELSSALGFLALSTMTMQFALTARFGWLAPPFGTDLVYAFHRSMTWVSLALVLAHPVALLGADAPEALGWLGVAGAPASIAAGVLALYALVALLVSSALRRAPHPAHHPFPHVPDPHPA